MLGCVGNRIPGPSRRDIAVDLARLQGFEIDLGAIARIRRHLIGLPAEIGLDGVGQLTRHAVQYIVKQAATRAKLSAHPHTLRHSCGYYLADRGTDFRTAGLQGAQEPEAHRALCAHLRPQGRGALQMIYLTRTDPARNMARFYSMTLQPTLFGDWALHRNSFTRSLSE